MPRATCRCGQKLSFPADGPERVICPRCSSKIRVKRREPEAGLADENAAAGDGYLRFPCPCGRRLKVRETVPRPQAGKCPDCGRVVPVPTTAVAAAPNPGRAGAAGIETPTEVMSAEEIAALERWSDGHRGRSRVAGAPLPVAFVPQPETVLVLPRDYAPPAPSVGVGNPPPAAAAAAPAKAEAGLRVCPRCGRPVHLGADNCRQCGAPVPRR